MGFCFKNKSGFTKIIGKRKGIVMSPGIFILKTESPDTTSLGVCAICSTGNREEVEKSRNPVIGETNLLVAEKENSRDIVNYLTAEHKSKIDNYDPIIY